MKVLRFVVLLTLVSLLHFLGTRVLPDFPRALDLFLVVTVVTAAGGSSLAGMLGGMSAGLVHDVVSGGLYGRLGFADTIVGYLTARVAQRLMFDRAGVILLTIVVATFAQQGILLLVDFGLLGTLVPPEPWWWLFRGLAGGLLGGLSYVASGAAQQARDRRRDRIERLRLSK